jgi:hypothetical protein
MSSRLVNNFALLAIGLMIAGCAALGVQAPKAFTDRAAVAQITVTQIRQQATTLLNAGAITAKDARNAQSTADAGNEAIDLALQFYSASCPAPTAKPCDVPTATAKLDAAIAVLTAAQVYLATKQKGGS